jgi:CDP-glucose 4,6-dehydratase
MNPGFWRDRRVLVTGHTGFKGSWLALWLQTLGARVTGLSLEPPSEPNLFNAAGVGRLMADRRADIRDAASVASVVRETQPEVVMHLAAQSLVRRSYAQPVETFATNVMGTVHVLDAVRGCAGVRAVVLVTSDKCYENREWAWGYRESDAIGGHDPYSASKGCAELVAVAYRRSFFVSREHGAALLATARAGNVIGGGDWATDRLIPDMVRAFSRGSRARIRNPNAVRPWQHVLEPLRGYLVLAERLCADDGASFADAWNFGPHAGDAWAVARVADAVAHRFGAGAGWDLENHAQPHESLALALDCSKSRHRLGWTPVLDLDAALDWTVRWYRGYAGGTPARELMIRDLEAYADVCRARL